MNNALLNNIATQIVAEKVMKDKLKEYEETDEKSKETENKEVDLNEIADNNKQEENDDDLFNEEDDNKFLEEIKNKRLMEIGIKPKARDRSKEKKPKKSSYGEYREIDESEFLNTLLKNEKVVCHFYHKEFEKCKIMDKHLIEVAFAHPETLFVKIDAEKSPFFCTKLGIQVLPTVLLSNNGKVFERIIGFEGLEGYDDFKTIDLIRKLVMSKMIKAKNSTEKGEIKMKKVTRFNNNEESSSDEDDY